MDQLLKRRVTQKQLDDFNVTVENSIEDLAMEGIWDNLKNMLGLGKGTNVKYESLYRANKEKLTSLVQKLSGDFSDPKWLERKLSLNKRLTLPKNAYDRERYLPNKGNPKDLTHLTVAWTNELKTNVGRYLNDLRRYQKDLDRIGKEVLTLAKQHRNDPYEVIDKIEKIISSYKYPYPIPDTHLYTGNGKGLDITNYTIQSVDQAVDLVQATIDSLNLIIKHNLNNSTLFIGLTWDDKLFDESVVGYDYADNDTVADFFSFQAIPENMTSVIFDPYWELISMASIACYYLSVATGQDLSK